MIVARTIAEFREHRRQLNGVGFVPTMGFLHEGHLSLMQASQQDNPYTVVSIFVNPTQFNNPNDLTAYPRDEVRDLQLLADQKIDVVFMPTAEEMYPPNFQTYVTVEKVSQGLEGEHRPGHFRGVATVVAKLLNIVQADRAYFGQKDAQQIAVIKQMVHDLAIPTDIIPCPILREADGLAMSSRNINLTPAQRAIAPILYQALARAESLYQAGVHDPQQLRTQIISIIDEQPEVQLEYVSIVDATTLQEIDAPSLRPALVSLAAMVGKVRLIDNTILG